MEVTQELQELIDQYLNGQLEASALLAFETRLKTDKALAAEVSFQRELHGSLADTPENELRKTLQQLSLQVTEATVKTAKVKWWNGLFPIDGVNHFFNGLLGHPQVRLAGLGAVLLMIGWWFSPAKTELSAIPSIAILPFTDVAPTQQQAYLGEGFAADILTTLTEVAAIKVAGQTASFAFKNQGVTLSDIGDELAVRHVLKGSVRRQDKKIRVTAELVHVADGAQVWSDSYEQELEDIFAIRDEVLEEIVMALLHKIAPEQQTKLSTTNPTTGAVYDLYLQAKHVHKNLYKSSLDLADFERSDSLFKAAIKIDPNYAPVHAGLADLYDSYWVHIQGQEGNSDQIKYSELMQQESKLAVQLAPQNAYANQVRGYILHHLHEPEAAFQYFLKSYRISPKNPESIMGLANFYLGMGLHEDALQFAEAAQVFDPLLKSPWMLQIFAHFYLSHWDKTVDLCQAFLAIDPNNQTALTYLFRTYFLLNQKEKALAVLPNIEAVEMLGLDVEIALLKADSTYIANQLASSNPNLAFEIYTYQGKTEKARTAYQQATRNYLNDTTVHSTSHNNFYLEQINNPQLKPFLASDWFQEVVEFEKRKYDYLIQTYPRAGKILL